MGAAMPVHQPEDSRSGERWLVEQGDCLEVLRAMPDACVDAVVTDPPAGIGFMGKAWDRMKAYLLGEGRFAPNKAKDGGA